MGVACRQAVSIDVRRNRNRADERAIRCLGVVLPTLLTSVEAVITDQVMKDAAS